MINTKLLQELNDYIDLNYVTLEISQNRPLMYMAEIESFKDDEEPVQAPLLSSAKPAAERKQKKAGRLSIPNLFRKEKSSEILPKPSPVICESVGSIEIPEPDESFADYLQRKIEQSGMTNAQCYNKANLNRQAFNKIINSKGYNAGKNTVIALAMSLELPLEDAEEFLGKAGYAFSSLQLSDVIIKFCIEHAIYDIREVNEILYAKDQALLGAGTRN